MLLVASPCYGPTTTKPGESPRTGDGRADDALHYARAALDNFQRAGPGAADNADHERRYIADLKQRKR